MSKALPRSVGRTRANTTESEAEDFVDSEAVQKKTKRHASVYDAVAARVSTNGFIPTQPFASKSRDTLSSNRTAVTPEEVLFRRKRAPTRYHEDDFYFANDDLPAGQSLPDSDLLKAIHTYSSDFYASTSVGQSQTDWRSMDETALLAVGILLEETAKASLGRDGDLVFVEADEVAETPLIGGAPSTKRVIVPEKDVPLAYQDDTPRKKRRLHRGSTVVPTPLNDTPHP